MKPLGHRAYGSIPHLIGSNSLGDKVLDKAHHNSFLTQPKNSTQVRLRVFVKYDGSSVSIAKKDGKILALTKSGYLASTSPFDMHWTFDKWVKKNAVFFDYLLEEGDRVCGEWMQVAHGIKYNFYRHTHDKIIPIILFDYFKGKKRVSFDYLVEGIKRVEEYTGMFFPAYIAQELIDVDGFNLPSISYLSGLLTHYDKSGLKTYFHRPLFFPESEDHEGFVIRREPSDDKPITLAKFVREGFQPGKYLPFVTKQNQISIFTEKDLYL